MENTYTAVIKRDGDWWIGWIEEIPGVNCQESKKTSLLDTLEVTLREALDLNRAAALDAADRDFSEELITLSESA